MECTERYAVRYRFGVENGPKFDFPLEFDPENFSLIMDDKEDRPDWTRLEHHQCDNCPFTPDETPRCPLALSLVEVIEATNQLVSHERVTLEVTFPDRTVSMDTTAQDALRSLMGLIIPTSGCPHTAFFRPMARFHLPVSTQEETLYRVTSMYMLAQYMRALSGLDRETDFEGLARIYSVINVVNRNVTERLREVCTKDSSLNAVVLLDVFAQILPMQLEDILGEFEALFKPYTS
jgi:uncharacterized protein DUF6901